LAGYQAARTSSATQLAGAELAHPVLLGTASCCANPHRAQWKVAAAATSCDVCGQGIFSSPTDVIIAFNITADATRTNTEVRASADGCCECLAGCSC
jgi:hypothetical protein